MTNAVLDNIKQRRSVRKFDRYHVTDEELESILEAGRWAPSNSNSQPWRFVVIRNLELKEALAEIAKRVTIFHLEIPDASVVVAVCVNQVEDPDHYVEDGAAAVQNMSLMIQSLGLASYWVGTYQLDGEKGTAEAEIKKLLDVPDNYRIIALLPIGKAASDKRSNRKDLTKMIYYEKFGEDKPR